MNFYYLLISLFMGCSVPLMAQNRTSLEKNRKAVDAQIKQTNKALWSTQSKQKKTTKTLQTLQKKLSSSQSSIATLQHETDSLETKIVRKRLVQQALQRDLVSLQTLHAKVLRKLYYLKLQAAATANNTWATSIPNQQQKKAIYLKHLQRHKLQKVKAIHATKLDLERYALVLQQKKTIIDTLLVKQINEKGTLEQRKNLTAKQAAQLSSKAKKLRTDLNKKQQQKLQLSRKIESIIKQQIAEAKKAAREQQIAAAKRAASQVTTARKNNSRNPSPPLVTKKIVSEFETQKGRLMSPIYQGRIISAFGKKKHPSLKGVYINNNGIDIKGQYNSVARNIFQGEVVSIFAIPGMNNAIMVKHGDYFTTYSNIAIVYVKQGQALKTGAQLGSIGRDTENGGHMLHFELWHGKQKQNPAHWLSGQ